MTQQVPVAMPGRIACQRCHASNEGDARFCKMCGAVAMQRPPLPVLTHVIEETENRMKIIDVDGKKTAQVECRVHTWMLGKPVPDDNLTEIKAMFLNERTGEVKIHVSPKEGTPGHQGGLAYIVRLTPKNIRFTMDSLAQANQANEIALDQLEQYGGDDEDDDESSTDPAINGSSMAMPVLPAGQG